MTKEHIKPRTLLVLHDGTRAVINSRITQVPVWIRRKAEIHQTDEPGDAQIVCRVASGDHYEVITIVGVRKQGVDILRRSGTGFIDHRLQYSERTI